jgi:two-component system, NtrC family, sensor kinase
MERKQIFISRLGVKLISITTAALLVVLAGLTYVTATILEQDLIGSCARNTYNVAEVVKNSTRYSMRLNLKKDVNPILRNIRDNDGIQVVRIYDKQGVVRFSADSTELGHEVGIESQLCQPCHNPDIPIEEISIDDRTLIDEETRELIVLNPIFNEPACYEAECHAHDESSSLLGVLEVRTPKEKIDEIVQANVQTVIVNAIIGALALAALSSFLIHSRINRPLRKIKRGIEEYSAGNLKHRVNVRVTDELSDVARQLNAMAEKLEAADEEIREWNRTLNRRVEEKTEELKSLYDQVVQVEKLASLGKLSATVAHELNNPLAGILNFSKLVRRRLEKMQKEDEFEKMIGHLTLIAEESDRCGRIVKDLLTFSRRGVEEFADENLVEIAEKSALLVDHHLEMNRQTLEKKFATDEAIVNCDAQKIQQALLSLMINAIEAMDEGGALHIEIETSDGKAVVRVRDEGHGIPEKDLPNIFEPFYTTKESTNGAGLGLSVVYGIIQNHNGKVEVEKTSSEGTTFTITLPLAENENERNA